MSETNTQDGYQAYTPTEKAAAPAPVEAPKPKFEHVERPADLREYKATREDVMTAFRNGGGKAIEKAYHAVRLGKDIHGNLVPDARGEFIAVGAAEADETSVNEKLHLFPYNVEGSTEGFDEVIKSGRNFFRDKLSKMAA